MNQTYDFELYSPSRFGIMGRPVYKPEVWDKVQQLDMWTNKYDPVRRNPNPDAGLLPERGDCAVYENDAITSQIRH